MTGERHSAYRRLSPLTPVVRGPLLVAAFLGASWQQLLGDGDRGVLALVLLGCLLYVAAFAITALS